MTMRVIPYYSVVVIYLYGVCLYGMDENRIFNNNVIAWEVILINQVAFLSHKGIRSVALVNHDFNNAVKKTVDQRKKCLETFYRIQLCCRMPLDNCVWHKYGSCCTWVHVKPVINRKTDSFGLIRVQLEGNYSVAPASWELNGFLDKLLYVSPLFFNEKDDVCLHLYSKMGNFSYSHDNNIVEYSLSGMGVKNHRPCMIGIADKLGRTILIQSTVCTFLPELLTAILSSRVHCEYKSDWWEHNPPKVFFIEGVTVPEACINHPAFNTLPIVLQMAVKAQYNLQKK